MEILKNIVSVLQIIAFCYQIALICIIVYGTIHKGVESEKGMKKYYRYNWLCCAFIFATYLLNQFVLTE